MRKDLQIYTMNNDNNTTKTSEPEEVTEISEATKEELAEMFEEEQTQSAELLADLNKELRRIVDVKDELARLISVIEDINTDKPNSYGLKSLKNQAKEAKTKTDFNSAEARVLIYQQMKDWKQQAPEIPFFEDLEEA